MSVKRKRETFERAATPSSDCSTTQEDSTLTSNGPKASKDRPCPFCHQAFTSSSLGRHLDLYIRPGNPKPPDGIHNVDEIRRIRGGITRRQPKGLGSSKSTRDRDTRSEGAGGDVSLTAHEKVEEHDLTQRDGSQTEGNGGAANHRRASKTGNTGRVNPMSWLATGVINDTVSSTPVSRNGVEHAGKRSRQTPEIRREPSPPRHAQGHDQRHPRLHEPTVYAPTDQIDQDSIRKLEEQAETGRAAEMALRELLGSIEAARGQHTNTSLFEDFDFCSLTFPALCLAVLPAPDTLFSSTPFPSAETWSLDPPSASQKDAVARSLEEKIEEKRSLNGASSVSEKTVRRYTTHLQASYSHWSSLSDEMRSSTWILETLRSFCQANQRSNDMKAQLTSSKQRVAHLESEYERLSRFQLPREWLLQPPNTLSISSATLKHLKNDSTSTNTGNLDADALIDRWKSTVRSVARPSRFSAHMPPRALSKPNYLESIVKSGPKAGTEAGTMELASDMMISGAVYGVEGPMSRTNHFHSEPQGRIVSYETPPEPGAILAPEEESELDE